MAYPPSRSANADMNEGLTDGAFKKVVRDRGGFVESTTQGSRKNLADIWYGVHEVKDKTLPDGRPRTTPDFIATTCVCCGTSCGGSCGCDCC